MNAEATANLNASNEARHQAALALNVITQGFDVDAITSEYRVVWETPATEIKSIVIPEKVSRLGNLLFYNSPLTSVFIPKGIMSIIAAFNSCKSLSNVVFEPSEDMVEFYAQSFYSCESLSYLEINRPFLFNGVENFYGIPETCEVRFPTLTKEEVLSCVSGDEEFFLNGFVSGMVFHCKDGDYVLGGES